MEKIKLFETFSGDATMVVKDCSSITESNGDTSLINGVDIIGMVEGQFFQPDGMSRNNRWYPRSLWENVLASADVKNRLLNHTMFGEIGHSDGPVVDETLRCGNASHIITDLWIDEKGRGMGRAYILGTETGKRLKIYLGAKSKLKVSTRGEGVYLEGQTHDGHPIIDPSSYELQTVDFVLNPGFLETNAKLTAQKENVQENKQVNETAMYVTKEGEKRMTLDVDAYVRELKEELLALKAENKSLSEELQTKEKELLKKTFSESEEVKKISEAYAPFKKMGVTPKSLNETLKRSQKSLQKAKQANAKLTEELKAYKDKCGSIKNLEEATKLSEKALNTISEYQKLGSVEDLKNLVNQSEEMLPKLKELSKLSEYKKLGSVEELKALAENCKKVLPMLQKNTLLEHYQKLGSVKDLKVLKAKCESLLPKLEQLKEAKLLARRVTKLLPKLENYKKLEQAAAKAQSIIESYVSTVGSLKRAKALVESRKETIKKVNVKEALDVSKKYGCTVESAAKLLRKYGSKQATESILEHVIIEKQQAKSVKLTESKKLVEEAQEMDKVNAKPEVKTAEDFLKTGMITNAFNLEALGKKIGPDELNKVNTEKVEGLNQAKELLKQYKDKVAVADAAPKLEPEKTAADAEAEAKKLLK